MLRLVHLAILPGVLLTTCAVWVSADTVTPPNKVVAGKQMYSNRPIGYTIPTPYYGTPMAPRFVAPTVMPYRITVVPGVRPRTEEPRAGTVVPVTVAPVVPVAPVPAFPTVVVSPDTVSAVPLVAENTTFILRDQPEVSVNDELDAFNARLAKMQLEKHQLTGALALVQNIKSETTKVRTVVELAEYVSRDKNYQSEAEQLYRLALAGIEALDQKQPFNIDVRGNGASEPVLPALRTIEEMLQKTEPVVVPEPPVIAPPVEPAPESPVSLQPLSPQPVPIEDDLPAPPEPPKPDEPAPRPPIILENDTGQNGKPKQPPPDPPRDEGNGIVATPPVIQPVLPVEEAPSPPALTQGDGLASPSSPQPNIPFPNGVSVTLPTDAVPLPKPELPFVRPKPIPLEDEPEEIPMETTKPPSPPKKRPLPPIQLIDEN